MNKFAWLCAAPLVVAIALLIALGNATPVQASGTVTDCSSPNGPNGFYAKLGGGGLVSFNCPFPGPTIITVPSGTGIVAALNTTVDGSNNGHRITLSGGNANRVFDQWTSGGTLTLTHLTLRDGYASGNGGCILNEGGKVVLLDVLVTHCQTAFNFAGGGIASPTGTLTLNNVQVISNSAGSGAGIAAGEAVNLLNTTISDNHADGHHALYDSAGGGLVLSGTASIANSFIQNNYAYGAGGGLFNWHGFVTLTLTTVSGNQSYNNDGGGINNVGVLLINNSSVSGNTETANYGGGLRNGGIATLTNVFLSGNTAPLGYGGGLSNEGPLTLANSTFSGNSAVNGGGIANFNSLWMLNSTLNANTALYGDGGGLWNFYQSTATLTNTQVGGNQAPACGGINGDGHLRLSGGTLSDNRALTGDGGALCAGYFVELQGVTISGNHAAGNGGGLTVSATQSGVPSVLTVTYATVDGNVAENSGGAINLGLRGELTMLTTTIGNNAAANGGGIFNGGNFANVSSATFVGNSATNGGGGGIYNYIGATTNLINTTLSGNSATNGGGLENTGDAALRNVTLSNNTATQGGALFMGGGTTLLVNTILAYSPAGGNCSGSLTSSKYSISSDNSCLLSGAGDHNLLDPLLTALGNYGGPTTGVGHDPLLVHMLKTGSPAIAGVAGNDAPHSDERGSPRPGMDGSYDIGAVEWQPNDSNLAPHLYLPLVRR